MKLLARETFVRAQLDRQIERRTGTSKDTNRHKFRYFAIWADIFIYTPTVILSNCFLGSTLNIGDFNVYIL